MGSKKNEIRLKRKRSFQGNQYIIGCKRNLIESSNSLSDTTGDHRKQISQLLLVLANHQKLNNSNDFIHSNDIDKEKLIFIMNFQILTEFIIIHN